MKTTHKTTFMSELNGGTGADVDVEVMPLVKFVNKLGFKTVSSGTEEIGSNGFAHVAFVKADSSGYSEVADFLFGQLRPMIEHLGHDVRLEVSYVPVEQPCGCPQGYTGWILVDPAYLDEVTKRVGCWMELLLK
jgi:hypothetical protein